MSGLAGGSYENGATEMVTKVAARPDRTPLRAGLAALAALLAISAGVTLAETAPGLPAFTSADGGGFALLSSGVRLDVSASGTVDLAPATTAGAVDGRLRYDVEAIGFGEARVSLAE